MAHSANGKVRPVLCRFSTMLRMSKFAPDKFVELISSNLPRANYRVHFFHSGKLQVLRLV